MDLPTKFSASSQIETLSRMARKQRSCIYLTNDWTPGSPDLNPLDYELWDILGQNTCQKRHPNLKSLKRSFIEEAAKV